MLTIGILIAVVALAINVGGNNSAAEMGPAFGAGVRSKNEAVLLTAIFSMIGAVVAGKSVVHTIANQIIPGSLLRDHPVALVVVLSSAALVISLANYLRLPVATSHAMIGAMTGVGIYYNSVYWKNIGTIVVWWLVTPLLSLFISYGIGRYFYDRLESWAAGIRSRRAFDFSLKGFITLTGCYMAFSAGSNSLAKAVGPVVGAGFMTISFASVVGGLGMASGAYFVGKRLLNTVGKGITSMCPLKAALVELTCGTIVLFASQAGVPVSLAEIVTCSVIGFGCARTGLRLGSKNHYVRKIYKLWPACPVITATASFSATSILKIFPWF